MDAQIRRLERLAISGDQDASAKLAHLKRRAEPKKLHDHFTYAMLYHNARLGNFFGQHKRTLVTGSQRAVSEHIRQHRLRRRQVRHVHTRDGCFGLNPIDYNWVQLYGADPRIVEELYLHGFAPAEGE